MTTYNPSDHGNGTNSVTVNKELYIIQKQRKIITFQLKIPVQYVGTIIRHHNYNHQSRTPRLDKSISIHHILWTSYQTNSLHFMSKIFFPIFQSWSQFSQKFWYNFADLFYKKCLPTLAVLQRVVETTWRLDLAVLAQKIGLSYRDSEWTVRIWPAVFLRPTTLNPHPIVARCEWIYFSTNSCKFSKPQMRQFSRLTTKGAS